jgi:hypothetical protein
MIIDSLIPPFVPSAQRLAAELKVPDEQLFVSGLVDLCDQVFMLGVVSVLAVCLVIKVVRWGYVGFVRRAPSQG